jgi:DNA-binding transcriptional ArsR family regulator
MSKKKLGAAERRSARESIRSSRAQPVRPSNSAVPSSVADDAAWHAVRSPLRLQVLEAIRAAPGVDARALSVALKTSAPRLYYHINILLQSGLIVGGERKDSDSQRQSSRGPEALAYRAHAANFPDGFFTKGEQSLQRREALVRELFDGGMHRAIASHGQSSAHLTVRRENLTGSEASRVKSLLSQVEAILDGARTRRHAESKVLPATHFVGCAFCEFDGELPDGPLA